QLTGGTDAAHSDDAANLKTSIVMWLPQSNPANHLQPHDKINHGLYNDVTVRSIYPVEFDWDNVKHQNNIQNLHSEYLIMANLWPWFIYKDGKYDPAHPAKGLFQGSLLVKAFQLMFTSSSSVTDENVLNSQPKKQHYVERHTRTNVADLLQMKKVELRTIAYVAVQVSASSTIL
ncbi:hypothetical protein HD554DRAFT_2025084, partial [Boletus coccyginus]